ncbi:MAG: hypothetical protein MJA29_11515 [Candidatus Omnitrophica bacterium]|nr:hypothetical protein [Candidatus Omnitrophota bacterium]
MENVVISSKEYTRLHQEIYSLRRERDELISVIEQLKARRPKKIQGAALDGVVIDEDE